MTTNFGHWGWAMGQFLCTKKVSCTKQTPTRHFQVEVTRTSIGHSSWHFTEQTCCLRLKEGIPRKQASQQPIYCTPTTLGNKHSDKKLLSDEAVSIFESMQKAQDVGALTILVMSTDTIIRLSSGGHRRAPETFVAPEEGYQHANTVTSHSGAMWPLPVSLHPKLR